MKIRIISKQMIKPSSPTPNHLRTHKLSLLDQIAPDNYFPTILYFSQPNINPTKISNHLKTSLSKILTHYYPFAGQFKDDLYVDCNDYGVTFIEAEVASDMSDVVKQADVDQLGQLLPCDVNPDKLGVDNTIVAIQVNYFQCGGVAICFCFRHSIVDATAAATFVKDWSKLARDGDDDVINNVIFDYTSIFPPQDVSHLSKGIQREHYSRMTDSVTKKFVFDGKQISALRKKINRGRPTRFEAVCALIWGAVIALTKEKDRTTPRHVSRVSVNLRKRMNLTLPEHCIGNIYQVAFAGWQVEKTLDYNSLVEKLHEAIMGMDDLSARKINGGGGFMGYLRNLSDGNSKMNSFGFSGWCRLPFSESDFGWGKPLHVSTAVKLRNFALLLDTSDGDGIEAWVGLSKEDMDIFENDPNILAHAS